MTAGKTTRSVFWRGPGARTSPSTRGTCPRQGGQDLLGHDPLRLLDEADLVAVADAELDVGAQQAVLALDHRRPLDDPDVGHRGERDLERLALAVAPPAEARPSRRPCRRRPSRRPGPHRRPSPGGDEDVLERLHVVAIVAGVADPDRVALAALDGLRQRPAAHRRLDHVLDVADVDPVAGRLLAVDLDLDVALARDLVGEHVGRAADRAEHPGDLLADAAGSRRAWSRRPSRPPAAARRSRASRSGRRSAG